MPHINPIDNEYFKDEKARNGSNFTVIGTPVQRSDARGHVTGRTAFFEDQLLPDLAFVKIHRSSRHHALITDVDVSQARQVPGVLRVITHADVPQTGTPC